MMAKRKHCVAAKSGMICVTDYTKSTRLGGVLKIGLSRQVYGRVTVSLTYTGPDYCGDEIHFGHHPYLTVFSDRVELLLDPSWFYCQGKAVSVERLEIYFVDEPSMSGLATSIRIDNPGITIKGEELSVALANQNTPYQPQRVGFAPILSTGPAVCTGPACDMMPRLSDAAMSTEGTTSSDKPGSIVIFPKTLQTQTVTRRYPKRRPGR